MTVLRNLSIRPRLMLAFGIILILLMGSVGLGISQMRSLAATTRALATIDNEKLQLAVRWRQANDLNWIRTRAAIQDGDPIHIASWQKEVDATSEMSAAARKRLIELVASSKAKAMMKDIDGARDAYQISRTELMKRHAAGEDVSKALDAELRPLSDRYSTALDIFEAHQQMVYDTSLVEAEASARESQILMVGGGIAALVVASLLAIMLSRSIVQPIRAATENARVIASGDLSHTIHSEGRDEPAALAQALRHMQAELAAVVARVRQGSEGVASASTQIAQGNHDLSGRTESQASALEETAASMEELSSTVRQNADSASQANQLAQSASTVALQGGAVMSQVVDTMKGISDSSKKIADIIAVIDGIAFQTNILALNAAVEAARAGEQGRGFAVVASEVRSLAGRSASAAKEIKTLIDDSVSRVDQGTQLVGQAGHTMNEVVSSIRRVTDIMGEISAASSEQSAGVSQVGEAVTQMDQATQQNAALVEEMAAAASSLNSQAQELVHAVAVFKLA